MAYVSPRRSNVGDLNAYTRLCGGRAPAEQWRLSGASLDHGHDGHGDTDSTRRCCVVSTGRTGPFTSLFSATTVPGAPATTLASPPLAQDPTLPGTSVSCAPTEVELSPSVESITSTTTSVSAGPTSALSAFGAIPSMSGPAAPTSTSLSPTLPTAMPLTIVGTVTGSTTGTIAPAPCSAARHREAHARRHLETRWPMLRPCRPPRPMSRRALHPEPFSRRRSTPTRSTPASPPRRA
ncbi:hypothetical protein ABIB06_002067 [Bradyrhizobium sp. LB8.2]